MPALSARATRYLQVSKPCKRNQIFCPDHPQLCSTTTCLTRATLTPVLKTRQPPVIALTQQALAAADLASLLGDAPSDWTLSIRTTCNWALPVDITVCAHNSRALDPTTSCGLLATDVVDGSLVGPVLVDMDLGCAKRRLPTEECNLCAAQDMMAGLCAVGTYAYTFTAINSAKLMARDLSIKVRDQ